ncbi:nitrous oxide reductase family maturation protein NosD [Azospirillum thermophilum]|uniref:Nitrous oxide reductase family maturation protein NosD n=1 Tax=Azospirillum thermophilum TaxID=2202148 RepID=A0A2S2CW00_9PROT|nr:nitrous oxide reductase family maturation protein NosD [Azospirillum thermophilum]AWK88682.1 nitrous oxide reductase family maturation protein NosD [Azospirillum thermophilum]
MTARFPLSLLLGTALAALASAQATAATVTVAPGELEGALAAAAAGDTLVLAPGTHAGGLAIDKPVTLAGQPGAVIDGGGRGSVLTINAPDVTVRGMEVRNSGLSLFEQNTGIFLNKEAHRSVIEDNRLRDNLIGIYVWGANDVMVRRNDVVGRTDLRVSERGNGIQIWNAPGTRILDNRVTDGRDGIFTTTSKRNVFARNRFERVRFAVHYMYTNDSEIADNVSIGNNVGFAIMYSNNLVIRNNRSRGDQEHGLLLNYANSSLIEGNLIDGRFAAGQTLQTEVAADKDMPVAGDGPAEGKRFGTWKCVFIYNANKNRLTGNRFEGCEIGVHFTAGSERNAMTGNAFIGNRTQVKYVGTRHLDWSEKGRGNYWSDNAAFDLNGDGIADEAYRPNDVVDRVMWAYPSAKLLMNSPGIQVIRWAQKQFPALHPGGVIDSAPLMAPPAVQAASAVPTTQFPTIQAAERK